MLSLAVAIAFLLVWTGKSAEAAQCACATTSVHVRSGAGTDHTVLGSLEPGHCAIYKGNQVQASGFAWAHVDFLGHDGWVATNWIHIGDCGGTSQGGSSSSVQLPGCPRIITRAEWHARAPTHSVGNMAALPKYVFIHHTASAFCHNQNDCSNIIRAAQNDYIDGRKYSDLGYNFMVGEDGHAYEVRGWSMVGAHTKGYNDVGIAISVIGDFTQRPPSDAALNLVKQLIQCGLDNHKISPTYHLMGHRDVGATACPGDKLYALIQHWPHYGH